MDGILTDDNDYEYFKQKFKKKDQKARKAIERKGGRDVRVFRDEDHIKYAMSSPDATDGSTCPSPLSPPTVPD